MLQKKSNNLGAVALTKARELQSLIDILNNTTIGSLSEDTTANANAIVAINNNITVLTNAVNINMNAISLLNAKIDSLATLFALGFDSTTGALTTEAYTTHAHNYNDTTIADTADGTGTETITTKTTEGVN